MRQLNFKEKSSWVQDDLNNPLVNTQIIVLPVKGFPEPQIENDEKEENVLFFKIDDKKSYVTKYSTEAPSRPLSARHLGELTLTIQLVDLSKKIPQSTVHANAQTLLDEIAFIQSIAQKDRTYSIFNLSGQLLETYTPHLYKLGVKDPYPGQSIRYALTNITDSNHNEMQTSLTTHPDKIISLPGALSIVPINLNALASLVAEINYSEKSVVAKDTGLIPPSSELPMKIPSSNLNYPKLTRPQTALPHRYPRFGFLGEYFETHSAYSSPQKIYAPALYDPNVMTLFKTLTKNGFSRQEALTIMTTTNNGGILKSFGKKFPNINHADIAMIIAKNSHHSTERNSENTRLVEALVAHLRKN